MHRQKKQLVILFNIIIIHSDCIRDRNMHQSTKPPVNYQLIYHKLQSVVIDFSPSHLVVEISSSQQQHRNRKKTEKIDDHHGAAI